jgi:hypothetical protein
MVVSPQMRVFRFYRLPIRPGEGFPIDMYRYFLGKKRTGFGLLDWTRRCNKENNSVFSEKSIDISTKVTDLRETTSNEHLLQIQCDLIGTHVPFAYSAEFKIDFHCKKLPFERLILHKTINNVLATFE